MARFGQIALVAVAWTNAAAEGQLELDMYKLQHDVDRCNRRSSELLEGLNRAEKNIARLHAELQELKTRDRRLDALEAEVREVRAAIARTPPPRTPGVIYDDIAPPRGHDRDTVVVTTAGDEATTREIGRLKISTV